MLWIIVLIAAAIASYVTVRWIGLSDRAWISRTARDDLFETTLCGHMEIDKKGRIRRVNQQECALWDLSEDQLIGSKYADLIGSPTAEQELEQKLTLQVSLRPYERKIQRRDATVVRTEVHETLMRNARGGVFGIRLATFDITGRARSEEDALKNASELKAIFKAFPDLFLRVNADGEVLASNGGDAKDVLLNPATFEGERLQRVLPNGAGERVVECLARVRRSGALEVLEYSTGSGEAVQTYECRILPLYWDNVIAVVRNITDRKNSEKVLAKYADDLKSKNRELEAAASIAREATRMKTQFLANMSHEIRTPMNGVLGMTEFLLETKLTAEQRSYTETIKQSADSLLTVINDILDLSKIEAGKLRLERIPFHLGVVLEEITHMFSVRAHAKGLAFCCSVPPELACAVLGDPGRLRQVLTNLLGNALKFCDHGEVGVRIVTRGQTADSLTVRFEVYDTGIGIAKDQQNLLFQSFTQLEGSGSRKYGGTGLGLAISKQLVELLGGEIGVDSEAGRGSTFWFSAVFEKQPEVQLAPAPEAQPSAPEPTCPKDLRVLVAADRSSSTVLTQMLTKWGASSKHVQNADGVLPAVQKAAKKAPFRVLLLDIDIPAARELADKIKKDPAGKDLLLISLTSTPMRGDGIELRERGFSGYLPKPVHASELYSAIAEVLRNAGSGAAPLVTRHTITEQKRAARDAAARVLLVEDNQVNQRVTLRLLEKLGVQADAVVNGREAVEAVAEKDYSLILMDCQMPEMDGFEAAAIIRNRERNVRHTPICALTANAMEGDRERCLAAGMDDYVSKPVGLEQLRQTIDRWIYSSTGVGANVTS